MVSSPAVADRLAADRALELYPNHKGFRRAFLRGFAARRQGRPVEDCPYSRHLYKHGQRGAGATWAWAWRRAWTNGWRYGAEV